MLADDELHHVDDLARYRNVGQLFQPAPQSLRIKFQKNVLVRRSYDHIDRPIAQIKFSYEVDAPTVDVIRKIVDMMRRVRKIVPSPIRQSSRATLRMNLDSKHLSTYDGCSNLEPLVDVLLI